MKLKFIYVLFFSAFSLILLQSRSNGPAANGLGDLTGSPLGGPAGCNCHGGISGSTMTTIDVKNGASSITSYVPGITYTLEFTVTGALNFSGFQAVALMGANVNAGTMTSALSPSTRITTFNGRSYAENLGVSTSGIYQISWVAPAPGSGDVTIYARGISVNGTGNTSGDQQGASVSFVLPEAVSSTTIDYPNTVYCANGINPTPTITGTQGGTFSSTPVGLSINPATGELDLLASTTGINYTIIYTYGGGSMTTDFLTISPADNASFTYGGNSWCQNASINPSPTGGMAGGTWSGTSGLAINSVSGEIGVSASSVGAHVVTYVTNGPCPDSNTLNITILAAEDASFTLSDTVLCQNGSDGTANVTGTVNGLFSSSPVGLSLDANTGAIDVSNSNTGAYVVTYTTSTNQCASSSDVTVDIVAADNAQFTLGGNSFCQNGNDVTPVGGTPGGTWLGSMGLVVDSISGTINVSASSVGNHTIQYLTNGACPDSQTTSLTILQGDVAMFPFSDTGFCQGFGPNPIFAVNGNLTGVYSATPSGLVFVDSTTGEISFGMSQIGNYTLTFTSTGPCTSVASATLGVYLCGGLEDIATASNFELYPNPSDGYVRLENKGDASEVSITIVDVLGQVVLLKNSYFNENAFEELDLTPLQQGTYFLKVQKEATIQTIKLTIK